MPGVYLLAGAYVVPGAYRVPRVYPMPTLLTSLNGASSGGMPRASACGWLIIHTEVPPSGAHRASQAWTNLAFCAASLIPCAAASESSLVMWRTKKLLEKRESMRGRQGGQARKMQGGGNEWCEKEQVHERRPQIEVAYKHDRKKKRGAKNEAEME